MSRFAHTLGHELQLIRAAVFMPGAGGALYHAVLPMNRCLSVGDYLVSANGMFFAIIEADGKLRIYRGAGLERHQGRLWESERAGDGGRFFALVQSDGNFCIYRGADLAHNEGWHWGTQHVDEGGQFYAHLQDDGNFAICKGSGPDDCQGTVWSSGVTDPVAAIDAVHAIDYQLAGARILSARPTDLYRETVNNASDQAQTSQISGSVTVADNVSWCDELKLSSPSPAAAGIKGPVPMVTRERVVLSSEAGYVYQRNSAASVSKTWGFTAPASVPPQSSMMCLVSAVRTTVQVPYTLTGMFTLKSGARVHGSIGGTYTGSNSHDLSVTMSTYDADPARAHTVRRPLQPLPSIVGPATPDTYVPG